MKIARLFICCAAATMTLACGGKVVMPDESIPMGFSERGDTLLLRGARAENGTEVPYVMTFVLENDACTSAMMDLFAENAAVAKVTYGILKSQDGGKGVTVKGNVVTLPLEDYTKNRASKEDIKASLGAVAM